VALGRVDVGPVAGDVEDGVVLDGEVVLAGAGVLAFFQSARFEGSLVHVIPSFFRSCEPEPV